MFPYHGPLALLNPAPPSPVVVWFRRDLRLCDHPALAAAARTGRPVVPIFVLDPGGRPPGAASRWWLHDSLVSLAADLRQIGLALVLRRGEPAGILKEVAASCGARHLFFNRATDPAAAATEARVAAAPGACFDVTVFDGDALYGPGSVRAAGGGPFKVFTPFWRRCLGGIEPAPPGGRPGRARSVPEIIASDRLADWRLQPGSPDWAGGLRQHWRPGERAAVQRLTTFVESGLGDYPAMRDRPGEAGTSGLSPHLHFGEISPRQVWHAIRSRVAGDSRLSAGGDAFLRQLGWREFSLNLLQAYPELPGRSLRPEFETFPWRKDRAGLRAWQRGETGYPFVDAGMRQLWATGWMHNRARMVAASFLVKHLLVHWREGEAWFWDTLVDADSANNAASWQWVAGSGTDAAPYFRIFNPALQGARFDPAGKYVRQWVPELAGLPDRFIHAPASAPAAALRRAGVTLGQHYPAPIVDHAAARARALDAYAGMRADRPARPLARRAP